MKKRRSDDTPSLVARGTRKRLGINQTRVKKKKEKINYTRLCWCQKVPEKDLESIKPV